MGKRPPEKIQSRRTRPDETESRKALEGGSRENGVPSSEARSGSNGPEEEATQGRRKAAPHPPQREEAPPRTVAVRPGRRPRGTAGGNYAGSPVYTGHYRRRKLPQAETRLSRQDKDREDSGKAGTPDKDKGRRCFPPTSVFSSSRRTG